MQSRNTFIVMRGYPSTGKSTFARLLATSMHAPLIDRDIFRRVVVDMFGNVSQVGKISYEMMFALIREQLSLGLDLVMDTPLTYRRTYDYCLELARTYDAQMLVVHCQCPQEVQKRRLEGRKGQVSSFQITSWEEWEQWKARYEDFEDHGCVIDTSHPIDESLAKVMRSIHELDCQQTFNPEQGLSMHPLF